MKIAIILSAVDKASRVINSTVGKVQKGLSKFGNVASIGGAAATLFFANAVKAAEDSEVATNRLSQVFKSMGQDYETATKQSAAYASGLQMQIGFEDEAIMAVQAKIATFEKASNAVARSNEIYNRATAAAFDMQATGFGDAEGNAVQLGKALQDPIKGITALRKSGITFTDAEKKKIEMLVKANRTFEAQDIVMKAIEKQVGGVAKATVTTSQKMRLAWGEVMERIGNGLLPIFTQFANYMLEKVIPIVSKFIEEHPVLVKWLGIASVALLALGVAAKGVALAMSGLTGILSVAKTAFLVLGRTVTVVGRLMLGSPVILAIAAVAAGAYLIIKNWAKIKAFFSRILNAVGKAFERAWEFIKSIPERVWNGMVSLWNGITGFFSNIWSGVKDITAQLWNAIGDAIMAPIVWIQKAWQGFKDWFTDLFKGPGKIIEEMAQRAAEVQQYTNAAAKPLARMSYINNPSPGYTAIVQRAAVRPAAAVAPSPSPIAQPVAMNRKGSGVVINQTLNVSGSNAAAVGEAFKQNNRDLIKQIEEAQRKKDRTKF